MGVSWSWWCKIVFHNLLNIYIYIYDWTYTWWASKVPVIALPIWHSELKEISKRSWCFQKYWYPKMDGLEWKTLLKWDDLGVFPYFWKHPYTKRAIYSGLFRSLASQPHSSGAGSLASARWFTTCERTLARWVIHVLRRSQATPPLGRSCQLVNG